MKSLKIGARTGRILSTPARHHLNDDGWKDESANGLLIMVGCRICSRSSFSRSDTAMRFTSVGDRCRLLLPGACGPRQVLLRPGLRVSITQAASSSNCDRSTIVVCNCTFYADNGGSPPSESEHLYTSVDTVSAPCGRLVSVFGGAAGYRPRVRSVYSMCVYRHSSKEEHVPYIPIAVLAKGKNAWLSSARVPCSRTADTFWELRFDPNTEAAAAFCRVGLLETNAKSLIFCSFPWFSWSTITSGRYSPCLPRALRAARILPFAAVRSRHCQETEQTPCARLWAGG